MKLRKAIEFTIREFGSADTYTLVTKLDDHWTIDYWADHKRLISKRTILVLK